MIFWMIVLIIIAIALGFAWRKDRIRRGLRSDGNTFGNHAEQRLLEEDHPVTMFMGSPAGSRDADEKGIGYWS